VFIHRSLKRDTTFVFYDTKYPFGQYSHRLDRLNMATNEISLDYGYETEYISWMKQSPWGHR
jgi:hypothetical protein